MILQTPSGAIGIEIKNRGGVGSGDIRALKEVGLAGYFRDSRITERLFARIKAKF
jgi:hypothetical protein